MNKLSHTLAGLSLFALAVAGLLTAQETKEVHPGKKGSPHVTTTYKMDGKTASITYGRPYKKNRKIFGELEAYGKVWRAGADEATTLETAGDMMIGPLHVVAGKYTLWAIPGEKEWTLVINKQTGQWGTMYNKDQDYGRTAMKLTKAAKPLEQLTITIEGKSDDKVLKFAWDDAVATVPIMMH